MALDLGIKKHRKGIVYAELDWKDVCWWRNCWTARNIILNNISTYDEVSQKAELSVSDFKKILIALSKEVQDYNFDDKPEADSAVKLLKCINDISYLLLQDAADRQEGIEWRYELIDNY